MSGWFVRNYYFFLLFMFFCGWSATTSREIHVVYATDSYSDYATKGVPRSSESVRVSASCHVKVHHATTDGHWSCLHPAMARFDVHNSTGYLRDKACAAWLRVFAIDEMDDIPTDQWSIYLDADTIVLEDLCPILHEMNSNYPAAAVKMSHYRLSGKDFFNASQLSVYGVSKFHRAGINNGVFMFHRGMWKTRNMTQRIWQWQIRASETNRKEPLFYYNDMAAMTLVFLEEGYEKLEKRFNCMQENDNGCAIRHYVGAKKPWN